MINKPNIAKILNIEEERIKEIQGKINVASTPDDYDHIRDSLNDIIRLGMYQVQNLSDMMEGSSSAKEYDALSKMLAAVTLSIKTLADVNIKKQDIKRPIDTGITEEGKLSLSTSELQQMLRKMKEGKFIEGSSDE